MFPRYTSQFITPILLLSLLLAGCGSSGDAILLSDGGPVSSGNTPVVTVTIAGVTFPSIHLEMTDEVTTNSLTVPYLVPTSAGVTEVHDHARAKTTCPGVPPRGNQCTFTHIVADGVEYGFADQGASHAGSAGDVSLDKHLQFYGRWLEPLERFPASGLFVFGGTRGAREILGGARRYSVFLNNSLSNPTGHQTFGVAFGLLYEGGKPPVGSATWHGIMVGRTIRDDYTVEVAGKSMLEYDFADHTIDLALSEIAAVRGGSYDGTSRFVWENLPYNDDGSFFMPGYGNHKEEQDPHPTLGYVDGDFYGPNAEEFAGVFERDHVIGAFGGCRGEVCRVTSSLDFYSDRPNLGQ